MPVSRNYYLLYEAFNTLGKHLYGHEWTANELTAARQASPEDVAAELEGLKGIERVPTRGSES